MQKKIFSYALILCLGVFLACSGEKKKAETPREIWTEQQANDWYKKQPWLIGANFIPSNAINQLEMWQAETFDTVTINRELGWAGGLGMNTVRVYLHDALYEQDSVGFLNRIDTFLSIAQKHKIKPFLVIFDSCWDPFYKLGKQREPIPFKHNSGWVQSPGQLALKDSLQYPRLESYVKGVIGKFANDERINGWDLWNEPDNMTGPSYEKIELPNKVALVLPLLKEVFTWARSVRPSQPLTSGIWVGDWSDAAKMKPIETLQLEQSDIITFHNYDSPAEFEKRIKWLSRYGKPLICTEYMARPNGSTFAGFLPIAKKYNVGMINWGFVDGKTQTKYPWDSWTKTYTAPPPVWFHEILQKDGKPYKQDEKELILSMTQKKD
ncbi:1,4-beta-xylanase [Pedobacter frigidisoli]|uniref:1,4-beta-xylanase n=1 Tax=Pedobacter frigidisoli TaxID=2530455 RepID=A0A4R0P589_9SPHI|nr:cellulase family glycosylhydrolase [Pedobacter frigidisoli]TCD11011.1 1,4-beta-xylanase [Pedobacter frigidisoli]